MQKTLLKSMLHHNNKHTQTLIKITIIVVTQEPSSKKLLKLPLV